MNGLDDVFVVPDIFSLLFRGSKEMNHDATCGLRVATFCVVWIGLSKNDPMLKVKRKK